MGGVLKSMNNIRNVTLKDVWDTKGPAERMRGTCSFTNNEKGFGFIVPKDNSEHVFFRQSDMLTRMSHRDLFERGLLLPRGPASSCWRTKGPTTTVKKGDLVEFDIVDAVA